MYKFFEIEKKEHIAVVTICREEALNAINDELMGEFVQVMDELEAEDDLRVAIITGKGRSFVAGADIATQAVMDFEQGYAWGQAGSRAFRRWENMPFVTIAAVNGFALGGGSELAISCDIILAGEKAKFGQPEVTLGITPGFSGTQRLIRKIGDFKAKELIFTGAHIKADEALRIGLVNKVCEQDKLMDEAMEMAETIAKNAPIAVKYSKQLMNSCHDLTLTEGIKYENLLFAECFKTEDQKTGMNAFLSKEKAVFLNK